MKRILVILTVGLATLSFICPDRVGSAERAYVFVSILPQKYFVERVGGDAVDVSVMVKPGSDIHTYEPKPQQMIALSKTRAYFTIGISFEKVWLPKIKAANPAMQIIHTEKGIRKIPMEPARIKTESTDAGMLDPHIWTAPRLVKIQVKNIFDGLIKVDRSHRSVFEANYVKFLKELDKIDTEMKNMFAGKKGLEFMVFHPAWGYFAKDYGLKQISIEIEGKKPKPAQLMKLIKHARQKGIKVIIMQPGLSTRAAETIAKAIGGSLVFIDPLAYDWFNNIRSLAATIISASVNQTK
ncbi:MAG: zinc ABC transporter substrate-binding protein [Deltaproteobacteria bacterium]|nr:zinc ABC transporter substrate-binding protein [Deltaproteobacteria bacterium]MBW1960270.1 zinc ABC transporter substrate-binding protein [Deltaproteobacteria bacterium]MBW1993680.1 zinc ABC transporter substrate-binding protein [Deltaproteobacteria bacterium]MBW2150317.1 zinc ABC transporter substrate-binding protein [Deltaproteobacteria bacterium]